MNNWNVIQELLFVWVISSVIASVVTSERYSEAHEIKFPRRSFLKIAGRSFLWGVLGTITGSALGTLIIAFFSDPRREPATSPESLVHFLALAGCFLASFVATILAFKKFSEIQPKRRGKRVIVP